MVSSQQVNNELISIFKTFNKQEESNYLDNYRLKIETPNSYIKQLGKELIADYNYKYFPSLRNKSEKIILTTNNDNYVNDYSIYFDTLKMSLIRLEQLFILNDLPPFYIYEFLKPTKNKFGQNISSWIKNITVIDVKKIKQLKIYLDEYFQFIFDRPKNIYKINKLAVPIDFSDQIKLDEFAEYLSRNSIVVLDFFDENLRLVSSEEANNKAKIAKLALKLIPDYCDNNVNTENKQCLIDLEQLII
ncbi:9950_t:CDS:2 [Rhizophagus irregularis]|nr:9950_t:CDS:2 [Rhizophagus irregularis]